MGVSMTKTQNSAQSYVVNMKGAQQSSNAKIVRIILTLKMKSIIGQALNEFKLLITQTYTQEMNLIQQAEKYQIAKTLFGLEQLSFRAISPNEKYLLIGTLNYMYLYDIKTKLNKQIYQLTLETNIAEFSLNSTKIIFANSKRIQIFDIETNKMQNINPKNFGDLKEMYVIGSSLYIIEIKTVQLGCYLETIKKMKKINLKSCRQVYSRFSGDSFYQDLITYQYYTNYQIFNDSTRKIELRINQNDYQKLKLILLNKYEILQLQKDRKLITWNIDYQGKRLIIKNTIPIYASNLLGSNPQFDYFYLILDNKLSIIDKKLQLNLQLLRQQEFIKEFSKEYYIIQLRKNIYSVLNRYISQRLLQIAYVFQK